MNIIYYFSGTGNSFYVAKRLQNQLTESSFENVELRSIYDSEADTISANTVGFVFPVYCNEAPEIVNSFIKRTKFNAQYIYAIGTYGGSVGYANNRINTLLKINGANLSYGDGLIMPDSCIIFASTPEKINSYLSDCDKEVDRIAQNIVDNKVSVFKELKSKILLNKSLWFMFKYLLGIKFKKTNKSCTKCAKCQKICPTKSISIGDKVTFGKTCQHCFACIQICPQNSIKFGFVKRNEKTKYFHPTKNNKE